MTFNVLLSNQNNYKISFTIALSFETVHFHFLLAFSTNMTPRSESPTFSCHLFRLPDLRHLKFHYFTMSSPIKLVVYFLCGHSETTTIDTERSSQRNRNLWFRVKKWTSSTPSETKHQQSAFLCTRCRETERRQIEMAAQLQAQMAENAAQMLKAQGQRRAAPPAHGVNATIAALMLRDEKPITKAIRDAQLRPSLQEQLQVVDDPEWQGEASRLAQRDLDSASKFWDDVHHGHSDHVTKTTTRSGPTFCPECKTMEIRLADPNQSAEDDPWNTNDSPLLSTGDLAEKSTAEPHQTPVPSCLRLSSAPSTTRGVLDKAADSSVNKNLPDLAPIDRMSLWLEAQNQSDWNTRDAKEQAHLREAERQYFKVMESRRACQLVIHPPKDEEVGTSDKKSLQEMSEPFFARPLPKIYPTLTQTINVDEAPPLEPIQLGTYKGLSGTRLWDQNGLGRKTDISLARFGSSVMAKQLPPLPPQDEEELETLKSGDDSCPDLQPISPNQDSNEPSTHGVRETEDWPLPSITTHSQEITEGREPPTPAPQPQRPRRPLTPDLPPMDPFSPPGLLAIQQIRNYFHIPASIPPSQFPKFMNDRVREGVTQPWILTPPAFGVRDEDIKGQLRRLSIRSKPEDIKKRIEILDISESLQWTQSEEKLGDGKSSWEESSDDDDAHDWEDPEERRKVDVDILIRNMLDELHTDPDTSPFPPTATSSRETDLPPRPRTPSPKNRRGEDYEYEAPQEVWDDIDDYYSDDEAEETGPRLVAISAPVSEDPNNLHRVKRRSGLRHEIVVVDEDEK